VAVTLEPSTGTSTQFGTHDNHMPFGVSSMLAALPGRDVSGANVERLFRFADYISRLGLPER
jgi:hypothetical protein